MGYEIKMIIGRSSDNLSDEWKLSNSPYEDGSGYEPERDDTGEIVLTGRKKRWFNVYATIDLCKLGHDENPLNTLIRESHGVADETIVNYFYTDDGNTQIKDDKYGESMNPVPLLEVIRAIEKTPSDYRRLKWAKDLLESMKDSGEDLSVMFFGH